MAVAHINRIGTAVPPNDVHEAFVDFVQGYLPERREQLIFKRMVGRSDIAHRYSFFRPDAGGDKDTEGFYRRGDFPPTSARMARYEQHAPDLAVQAIDALGNFDRAAITHLIVGSCTGFVAPGLDQIIVKRAGLDPTVERTVVGFMGCYAAVNSLRLAHHIIRSEPSARVLVINLELCSLHFQETGDLEKLLSMLLFGDGCAATLLSTDPVGFALKDFKAAAIDDLDELITWRIGDSGFDMKLSGEVPIRIGKALTAELARNAPDGILRGQRPIDYDIYAVHAGGRSILDAVEQGFELAKDTLKWSRGVLRDYGNMSSATLMFVLERILNSDEPAASGLAMAFGPGLACETFRFSRA